MANAKEIFGRHYDRIIAVAVLAILLLTLAYLVLAGMERQAEVQRISADFNAPTKVTEKAVERTAQETLIATTITPAKASLLQIKERPKEDAHRYTDLFTSEGRFLCVNKECAKPIIEAETLCRFCKAKQPVVEKVDYNAIDSDGDRMTDAWETTYGLDPNNAEDADGDLDNDGFSNYDEFIAKTDPKNIESHPAYEEFITLAAATETRVPLRLVKEQPGGMMKMDDGTTKNVKALDFVRVDAEGNAVGSPIARVLPGKRIGKTDYRYQSYNDKAKEQREYTHVRAGATTNRTGTAKMFVNVSSVIITKMSPDAIKDETALETAEKELTSARLVAKATDASGNVPALEKKVKELREKATQNAQKELENQKQVYELAFYDEKYYTMPGTTWQGEPLIGLEASVSIDLLPETLVVEHLLEGSEFDVKHEKYKVISLEMDTKKKVPTLKISRVRDEKEFVLTKKQ